LFKTTGLKIFGQANNLKVAVIGDSKLTDKLNKATNYPSHSGSWVKPVQFCFAIHYSTL